MLLTDVARRPSRRPSPASPSLEVLGLGTDGKDHGYEGDQAEAGPRQQATPAAQEVQNVVHGRQAYARKGIESVGIAPGIPGCGMILAVESSRPGGRILRLVAAVLSVSLAGCATSRAPGTTATITIPKSRPPLPPISGGGDLKTNESIEKAVAQYVELQQSPLVPNVYNSPSWPSVTPTSPSEPNVDVRPIVDASGAPTLSPELQASMVKAASAAIDARQTHAAQKAFDYWLPGAIGAEASEHFQVVGAGAYLETFKIVSESDSRATVTAQCLEWQHQMFWNGTSETFHKIQNETIDGLVLVQSSTGSWLVDDFNLASVPGRGP